MIEAVCIALVAFVAYREYANAQERQSLLDRIQAPEVVVQRQVIERTETPAPVPPDMGPWSTPPPEEDE